jgi:dihydrofolate reductase
MGKAQGALVCERFEEAVEIAREQAEDDGAEEICVIGGAALFALALPKARRIYLTEVEAEPEGDVVFPPFDETGWREVRREAHAAGEGDDHDFVFRVLERG